MSLLRILQTTAITASHAFVVNDTPTDAAGAVTVAVNRLDGSPVAALTASHTGTGTYAYPVPVSAVLDTWTADWSGVFGGATVRVRDIIEIVGGHMFSVAAARAKPSGMPVAQYPTAALEQARIGTEDEAERIAGVALVPRFKRRILDGSGTCELLLPDVVIRQVRAVTVDGTVWSPAQVAEVQAGESGVAHLDGAFWPWGRRNVIIEYDHGYDFCPANAADMGIVRMRSQIGMFGAGQPYRALSFQAGDGGFYRIAQAGPDSTGIPDVDAAYKAAGVAKAGFA